MTRLQRSLLVVGPSWIGDMVMAQALFKALRERDGELAIDVVAPAAGLPLVERMPEVRHAFELRAGHGELALGARRAVAKELGEGGYERAIVLPLSFKSALVPFFARIPVRTGFRGEMRYGLINDMRLLPDFASETTVRRFLTLAHGTGDVPVEHVPQPTLEIDEANADRLVSELGLETDRPVVALAPSAAHGPAKRWPVERFASLAEEFVAAGAAVWVVGGPGDAALGDAVVGSADELGGGAYNLCGKTSLLDAVDLLSRAPVVVANDSGLTHVAAAVGSHVVAIYGPIAPSFAPPLTATADLVYKGIECSPCFQTECPLGHHNCMRLIPVDDVRSLVSTALGRR